MLEIIEFLTIPRVVATVHRPDDLDFLSENDLSGVCDLLELRLDGLRDCLDRAEEAARSIGGDIPIIITARDPAEGGEGDLNAAARARMLRRFLPQAAFIDVEVRSIGESGDLIGEAHQAGVGVIASFHDFEKTPPMKDLQKAVETGRDADADVIKLAVRLDELDALTRLAALAGEAKREGTCISAMGMGTLGKLSRLTLATAGSCLNYGYLCEANAPGQWPARELLRRYGELGLR